MLKKIYNIFRPDTTVEFWHFLPEIKELLEPLERQMIDQGLMISCINIVSEDGLLFTRIAEFPNQESFAQMKELIDHTLYESRRIEYNTINFHIFFSSDEE